jgi:hypothetical protein
MRTFKAGNRETPELRRLAQDIEKAAHRSDDRIALQYLSTLPERPSDGLYLFAADVTAPGDLRGLYRCDGGTYTFIG